MDEETIAKYVRLLDRHFKGKTIKSKDELREIVYSVEKNYNNFVRATRNLIHYLQSRDKLEKGLANSYLELLKMRETRVTEIYPDDKDITKAYEYIKEKWDKETLMLFKLLVYSGIRVDHALEMLWNFKKEDLIFRGDVAYYPISKVAKGKKKAFIAVMPAEFARQLKPLPKSFTLDMAYKRLNVPNNKVSGKTIRKWSDNFFVLHGVPESVSDFMQGRSSVTVGSKSYLNKIKQSVEWYHRVMDKFPIPLKDK